MIPSCSVAVTSPPRARPGSSGLSAGVLEKLVEEQEYVEWTPAALAQNRGYQRLGYVGLCVAALLLLTLAAMIVRLVS